MAYLRKAIVGLRCFLWPSNLIFVGEELGIVGGTRLFSQCGKLCLAFVGVCVN